ncbi:class I SAM-dependent methyltransferase [Mesorhizobium sp. L-8-3]|uniref:class I SAM-dependent methyltransferase n=1 Tax=Mesorhizobium sp. L-8-3 TaxID=2744522 RepID=UPI0019270735|nr:class I SAM-dependent methyltransferase [Mesorhizobium sp. L-8-3]BCH21813.1 hypothetical protein MesoLjLb_15980 [Mesorhizobium sp. L-8-3]
MAAYCFFDVREITDQAKVDQYLTGVFATVEQYGGRYLVLGGKSNLVEGDWQPVYPVIVEFSDREQAQRWYWSREYEPLKALRLAGTRSNAVFLEGVIPRADAATIERRESKSPAEIYDALFVPALFRRWGPVVADAAQIAGGQQVLDVACGTGVLALAALDCVGPQGKVLGIDANPDMLSVARRKSDRIDWRDARAEALPFPDARFDAVVSQFGLMFFDDRVAGLREMMRVLKPGGRLAVAVCDALERSPGYAAVAALLERLFGDGVANAFRAPFVLGDPELLYTICAKAGVANASVKRHHGMVRFASIESLISTERACVWTLGGLLDQAQFEQLVDEAEEALQGFVSANGDVAFDMPALIITATKN